MIWNVHDLFCVTSKQNVVCIVNGGTICCGLPTGYPAHSLWKEGIRMSDSVEALPREAAQTGVEPANTPLDSDSGETATISVDNFPVESGGQNQSDYDECLSCQ
jgi:hypothetical protein